MFFGANHIELTLDEMEVRILGCLMEKESTTPDYYPLTLNSLVAACNQKSNRNPVTAYDEETVERTLESLKQKGLVQETHIPGGRASKYRQSFVEKFKLIPREAAMLCELMLRGRQTAGELKGRADRMYAFKDMMEVEETLNDLMSWDAPLIIKLKRETGRKESRYMHLLAGTPDSIDKEDVKGNAAIPEDAGIAKLQQDISELREELNVLKKSFEEFKARFE